MKTNNGSFNKVFLLIIPIGIVLLLVGINYGMNIYYQKKLQKDTIDVLNYIVTKDYQTSAEYKEIAMEKFTEKGYEPIDEALDVLATDDYILIVKYDYTHDLKSFLNIFKTKWTDDYGYLDDTKINESMNKNTGMVSAKYIVKLNEYREPIIEEYKGDEEELFRQEREKQEQTTQVVANE